MRPIRIEDFDPKAPQTLPANKPVPALRSPMDNLPRIEKPTHPTPPPAQALIAKDAETASPRVDMSTRPPVHMSTSGQDYKSTSPHVDMSTNKQEYIRQFLQMKSSETPTFRCPPSLWEKVEELQYLFHKRHKMKLSTAALMVAAMASLFWDIECDEQGSDSYKLLLEQNES